MNKHKKKIDTLKKLLSKLPSMTYEQKVKLWVGVKLINESKKKKEKVIKEYSGLERNVVSKDFYLQDVKYDVYVSKYRGIQFTDKEIQAFENFKKYLTPSNSTEFFVKYENADEFGNNTTIIVKKHKQNNQFIFAAYIKYFSGHDTPKPEDNNKSPEQLQPPQKSPKKELPPEEESSPQKTNKKEKETGKEPILISRNKKNLKENVEEKIRIIKSIPFSEDSEGANILADFLLTLND